MSRKPATPKPTGEYAVGTRTFTVYNTRKDVLDKKGAMRHVSARIYYPVTKNATEGLARARSMSRNEAAGIKKAFMIPLNYDKMEASGENEAQCYMDAPFIADKRFPLIVFNHGYFSYIEGNSFLLIELASHGYVVLSVGHPYEGASADYDDGTYTLVDKSLANKMYHPFIGGVLAAYKLTRYKGTLAEQAELFEQFQSKYCTFIGSRVDEWITDTEFAVEYAKKEFAQIIDLTGGIGISGHSQGGAVAYKACLTDPEYTCGINIDGGLFGEHNGMTMNKPFMQLSCEDNENVVTKGYLNHSKPAYKVLFRGMKHMGFADIKFGMKPGMMAGKLDAESAHNYSCRSFLEFFDCYLKKTKDKPDLTSDDVITVTEFAPDVK